MAIGVDIEDIDRFVGKSEKFLNRVYTPLECDYCLSKSRPESHLAVRFCAKEAVVKALTPYGLGFISYKDIEIFHTEKGCPAVRILVPIKENFEFEISLSHDKTKAIAFVVAKKLA